MGAITIVTAGAVVLEPTLEALAFWLVFAACIGVLAAEAFRPGKFKPREQAEQSKKGTPWASIWITAAAPVALLVLVPLLASLERPIFNDLRLHVDAVEIDDTALSRSTLGFGGAIEDEFRIPDAPASLVELHRGDDGLLLTFPNSPVGEDAWVFTTETGGPFDKRIQLLGSIPLRSQDALCLVRCADGGRHWATLVDEGGVRRLVAGDPGEEGPVLIRPQRLLTVTRGASYKPTGRIYPLRDILPSVACSPDDGCDPDTLRSFIWDAGNELRLLVLDPEISVDNGGNVRVLTPTPPPLLIDRTTTFGIGRVAFAPPGLDIADRDEPASRIRGRTRFEIEPLEAGASVRLLDTDPIRIDRQDAALEFANNSVGRLSTGGGNDANAQLAFPAFGGAAAGGARGALYLPVAFIDGGAVPTLRIESRHDGTFRLEEVRLGEPFSFQDVGVRPVLHVTQEAPPWLLIGLMLLGWAILTLCQFRLWRTARVTWILSTGVQLLLALRSLVALEAAYTDLSAEPGSRLLQAAIAFLVGGGVMALAGPRHKGKRQAMLGLLLVLAATLAHGWVRGASVGILYYIVCGGFIAAAVPVALWSFADIRKFVGEKAPGFVNRIWTRFRTPAQAPGEIKTGWLTRARRAVPLWVILGGVVFLLRIGLALAGVTERRFVAISLLYLPPMLLVATMTLRRAIDGPKRHSHWFEPICCAAVLVGSVGGLWAMTRDGLGLSLIWRGYLLALVLMAGTSGMVLLRHGIAAIKAWRTHEPAPPIAWWGGWCFIGVLGFLGVFVPWLVRDVGFAPLILAPLGVAAWVAMSTEKAKPHEARLGPAWAWTVPLVFCLALVALPKTMAIVSDESTMIEQAGQADASAPALSVLEHSVGLTQNPLRILLLSDPEQTRLTGTNQAESLSGWSAYLDDFTRQPFGNGYLADVRLGPLSANHQDDNLSAVHLMSPYGRLGAMLFLVWLGCLALCTARAYARAKPPREDFFDTRHLMGLFAVWTPFAMGAYMILANLQMIPFTGRNVYLLAAFSGSDLVEGLSLFILSLCLLGRFDITPPPDARRSA